MAEASQALELTSPDVRWSVAIRGLTELTRTSIFGRN